MPTTPEIVTDLHYVIDAAGNIDLMPVPGNYPAFGDGNRNFQVAQGTRPNVIFHNYSSETFRVNVTGSSGDPRNKRLFGGDPPNFGGGDTTLTVGPGTSQVGRLGSFPDQGTYLLSAGARRTSGVIVVHPGTIFVYQLSGGDPMIIGAGGGPLGVMRGVPLPVTFVNRTDREVTVYTEGTVSDHHPDSLARAATFFDIVANGPVTLENGKPVIKLNAGRSKVATISANADLGDFNFSTHPPPFTAAGPCTYHVHM